MTDDGRARIEDVDKAVAVTVTVADEVADAA
jgi:hypothetical protein